MQHIYLSHKFNHEEHVHFKIETSVVVAPKKNAWSMAALGAGPA